MSDLVTTLLEALGLLLLAAAAGVALGGVSLAGGFAVAGLVLLVESAIVTALVARRRRGVRA